MNRGLLAEILVSKLASKNDPNVISFNKTHKIEGKIIIHFLSKSKPGVINTLANPILRNSFLFGCSKFTENMKNEFLIVGYGKRRGGGIDIEIVTYIEGFEDRVPIPDELYGLMHLASLFPKRECIIFHNHPPNWLNKNFRKPMPSIADRDVMFKGKYFNPIQILNKFIDGRTGISFFLGENGKVQEIRSPNFMALLNFISE